MTRVRLKRKRPVNEVQDEAPVIAVRWRGHDLGDYKKKLPDRLTEKNVLTLPMDEVPRWVTDRGRTLSKG